VKDKCCETCKFWERLNDDSILGKCSKHVTKVIPVFYVKFDFCCKYYLPSNKEGFK